MTCNAASLLGGVTPIIPTILTGMIDPCGGRQVCAPAKQESINRPVAAALEYARNDAVRAA